MNTERDILLARHKLRTLVIILLLAVLLILATDNAEAATKTMYLKQQTFSYLIPYDHYTQIAAVYGKGEAVTVSDKVVGTSAITNERVYFYKIKQLGKTYYIRANKLTKTKPKYRYRADLNFYELKLKEKVKLYFQPTTTSLGLYYKEDKLLTIGETKNWYKVYVNGKVCFIRKTNKKITSVSKIELNNFELLNISDKKIKNIKKRYTYFYALLPEKSRDIINDYNTKITICKTLPDEKFENNGNSGYAGRNSNGEYYIYIKETTHPYVLEQTLHHEVGHILHYAYSKNCGEKSVVEVDDTIFKERKKLKLGDHYQTKREYIAEAFAIYVLEYKKIKENTPNTFSFLSNHFLVNDKCVDNNTK